MADTRKDNSDGGDGGGSVGVMASRTTSYALRLCPGQEIVAELEAFARRANLRAAFIQSCVGSVKAATLRMASATADSDQANHMKRIDTCHEIVSLVGTLCIVSAGCGDEGTFSKHLHACLSDADGRTIGGHVISLEVFTTAEIVVGECTDLVFTRPMDSATGYPELAISRRQTSHQQQRQHQHPHLDKDHATKKPKAMPLAEPPK